ncbi:unnamed protein product [Rotaria magnacalcarata]|uniref:UDP-N-acetylglucosamine--peptide N-acetylglucosaminyltransferase SPINDLY n=1 Tax=Rotaria magnacalcarata TaxID=392030 RepID=A0A816YEM1_9BILA|nr:unnamed protein product [Rotaria magnacalcarata]CAF4234671.1 unnamed protein product [Rotaria magnacalcarata]
MDREELKSAHHSTRRLTTGRRPSISLPPVSSSSDINVPLRSSRRTQKFILVWLDSTISESDANYHKSLIQLKELVNNCKIFTDTDKCVRFLTQVANEKVLLIVSGFTGEYLMPLVHDMTQIDSIYVLSVNVRRHEIWTKMWPKIIGVFMEINSVCEILKQIFSPTEDSSTTICSIPVNDEHGLSLGFLAANDDVLTENLDELDPSFMFTKVLKEILLELQFDKTSMNELAVFCRELFSKNDPQLKIVDDFQQNYHSKSAIWWYTCDSFVYSMLNRALRTLEVDAIIKMGFFLRDLHEQIVQLHREQFMNGNSSNSFTAYRGQALTTEDFSRLMKAKGGLMSFNNFLSTSTVREIALDFACRAIGNTGYVAVLFVMHIDPLHSSIPFAHIEDFSHFNVENETLFSMHSVFRIISIKHSGIDHKDVWEVNLTITNDDDPQLHVLTERLREETRGLSGWDRMGKLLIKLGMYNNAEHTYDLLLKHATNDIESAHFYHQLGYIKEDLGKYDHALSCYERSLEIKQKNPYPDRSDFAMYYNNVGSVYDKKGDYSKAASFFQKAIDIFEQILPPRHPRLATCYNNIASANHHMFQYSTALSYYEKALKIDELCLSPNDPLLAINYNNIGLVYHDMEEYSKALLYYEKTLAIYHRSLQLGHVDFSNIYSNVGSLYNSIKEYSKALSYYEKAREIDEKTLPSNHPYLGISYNNIGSTLKNMEEYSTALSMFQRALQIEKSSQSPNDSRLQLYTKNIEFVTGKKQ